MALNGHLFGFGVCRKSQKIKGTLFQGTCCLDDCSAKYTFTICTKPKPFQNSIDVHVVRFGDVTHKDE